MKRIYPWVIISLIIVFALSACDGWLTALKAEVDLTIHNNGSWKIVMLPTYSASDVETYGLEIETGIQTKVGEMTYVGMQGNWKKVKTDSLGNVTYRLEFSAKDIQLLNDYVLEDSTAVTFEGEGGQKIWRFDFYPNQNVFNDALEWTFTLHAGKVLTSNGDQSKANMVVWTYPYQSLRADFKTGFAWPVWLTIVLIVFGVLAAAGGVVAIILTSKKKAHPGLPPPMAPSGTLPPPAPGMPLPTTGSACQKCGNMLAPGIAFCPKCGTKRDIPASSPPAPPPPAAPSLAAPPPVSTSTGAPPPLTHPPKPPAMPKKKK